MLPCILYLPLIMGTVNCTSFKSPTKQELMQVNEKFVYNTHYDSVTVFCYTLEFDIPKDKSYHVFLFEDGEILSLVTQLFVNVQPSLKLDSDTMIYLSSTVTRVSDQDCEPITAMQIQQCLMERIKDKIQNSTMPCLPFQVQSLCPALLEIYPQCMNETEAVKQWSSVSIQSG